MAVMTRPAERRGRPSSLPRIYRLSICTERCPVVAMMARSEAQAAVAGVPRRIEIRCLRSPERPGLITTPNGNSSRPCCSRSSAALR
jgi:hypothetical protein